MHTWVRFGYVTNNLSDLSSSQVFLAADQLSRQGKVRVMLDTGNLYMIRLPGPNRVSATREV
jgi:hypothetical protein